MTVLPFRGEEEITSAIPQAAAHLEQGGLIAYPTETVYGLGSKPADAALEALARLKGRGPDKPFLLLVSSRDMVQHQGLRFTPAAAALAEAFWPGPLTLVLGGGEGLLPDALRGSEGGIAVRWTAHEGVARLISELGVPLTSTSANRAGGPVAPDAEAILDLFGEAVRGDLGEPGRLVVLDGGAIANVPPSTLIDCTTSIPTLLREGAITHRELLRCGRILV
jgi:L-threonylcarbamoyladenylate synthase